MWIVRRWILMSWRTAVVFQHTVAWIVRNLRRLRCRCQLQITAIGCWKNSCHSRHSRQSSWRQRSSCWWIDLLRRQLQGLAHRCVIKALVIYYRSIATSPHIIYKSGSRSRSVTKLNLIDCLQDLSTRMRSEVESPAEQSCSIISNWVSFHLEVGIFVNNFYSTFTGSIS